MVKYTTIKWFIIVIRYEKIITLKLQIKSNFT